MAPSYQERRLLTEKLQRRLKAVLKRPSNKVCSECSEPEPTWAVLLAPPLLASLLEGGRKLAVLCCYNCYSYHFQLGNDVCTVKSAKMASEWTEEEVELLEENDNVKTNTIYEAFLGDFNDGDEKQNLQQFVENKYLHRKYFSEQVYLGQTAALAIQKTSARNQFHSSRSAGRNNKPSSTSRESPKKTTSSPKRGPNKENTVSETISDHHVSEHSHEATNQTRFHNSFVETLPRIDADNVKWHNSDISEMIRAGSGIGRSSSKSRPRHPGKDATELPPPLMSFTDNTKPMPSLNKEQRSNHGETTRSSSTSRSRARPTSASTSTGTTDDNQHGAPKAQEPSSVSWGRSRNANNETQPDPHQSSSSSTSQRSRSRLSAHDALDPSRKSSNSRGLLGSLTDPSEKHNYCRRRDNSQDGRISYTLPGYLHKAGDQDDMSVSMTAPDALEDPSSSLPPFADTKLVNDCDIDAEDSVTSERECEGRLSRQSSLRFEAAREVWSATRITTSSHERQHAVEIPSMMSAHNNKGQLETIFCATRFSGSGSGTASALDKLFMDDDSDDGRTALTDESDILSISGRAA